MNKKISFEASISATKNQFCPRIRIKPEGTQLLNELMNSINSSLIQTFDQEYDSAKKINTDTALKCAQKAVSKVVPVEFRRLAAAHGQSQLMLYQQGELEYDFGRSRKEINSSQQKRPRSETSKSDVKKRRKGETLKSEIAKAIPKKSTKDKLDFSKEILEIFVKIFAAKATPSVSINRSGVEKLNICLNDVLKRIIKECESESTVSAESVSSRVENYFPGELTAHAMEAAARMLMITQVKNEKQTDRKQASLVTKAKGRAEDTEEPRETGATVERRESARESSEESEGAEMEADAIESEAEVTEGEAKVTEGESEGEENEPNNVSPTIKEDASSPEFTETVPTSGEPEDSE